MQTIRAQLLDALAQDAPIEMDLTGVTRIDLAAIQLIESARRQAVGTGQPFTLAEPTPACLRNTLKLAGFNHAADPALRAFWFNGDPQ
ncbi:STAS domain-containing protein [Novosphingobium sp. FSY-8]|uniref:STAS domain-containing protein n=1 Tax=Novosphingobium ovatum TaxID=1908523 RepID=A0ABW9XA87_9SPHN|nr:STAS domain-containing protein [Novosphingobium ovatum]NBC35415.1 STAS domain-containing protein [Novosphingobium ovatum]